MSAVILAFKAPKRPRPAKGGRDPDKAALILAMLREIGDALEARQRGQA